MTPQAGDEYGRAIFDQAFAGICQSDRTGRLVRVNDRYCEIVGRPRTELLCSRLQDVTQAEDGAQDPALFKRLISHGEPFTVEKRCVRPDGTAVWVQENVSLVIGAAGAFACVLAIVIDISARKHAERAAHQDAERFRFVAESMPQKIFTATPSGDLDYLNQPWVEFTGLPLDEIRRASWTPFIHPDDVEENVRLWQRSLDAGEPFQFEHRLRRADGIYHWHLSRAHAMRGVSGEITMWIGSSTDIDEVKRTEQALHYADQKKDEFLAMLGHELRNPLAPILTSLQLMKLRDPGAGLEREREVIERQVRHVARLVDDLLDVSKITRGKVSLQREPIEIFVAIAKAIEIAEPIIERRTHRLRVDVPTGGLAVDGDPFRLSQVISNLLTNAALYTPHGGSIELSARREGADVVIAVADTGTGIAAQLLPRVFDMFTQGVRASDRSEGGLGLGLGLVQSLVKLHGGSVTAESGGPGKGSCFTVRLPALERTPSTALDERLLSVSAPLAQGGMRQHILLVDDNIDAAESLAELLRTFGHAVAIAYDGPQALIALESFDADVAVLDIGLPVMDGYELAGRIRAAVLTRTPRLVAVTGYGQPDDLARSRKAGFDEHLVKPVDIDLLIEAIQPVANPIPARQRTC